MSNAAWCGGMVAEGGKDLSEVGERKGAWCGRTGRAWCGEMKGTL